MFSSGSLEHVQAETYSAQEGARKLLMQENALDELEELMNQIFARKAENVPAIPYASIIPQSRTILTLLSQAFIIPSAVTSHPERCQTERLVR